MKPTHDRLSPAQSITPAVPASEPPLAGWLLEAARQLRETVSGLSFSPPVTHVYNPLRYAWAPYKTFVRRYGSTPKRVVFLGMNPGPFGMVQTGIPFGEIAAVRDWLGIDGPVGQPAYPHPKRPVDGFACKRSEVSGRRLWGLFAARFGLSEEFFLDHFVLNYCPLVFMEAGGRNLTPDKLAAGERHKLFAACDQHLRVVVEGLRPEWVIGVGDFAQRRAAEALDGKALKLGQILQPSPASPAANRDWSGLATSQLVAQGIWPATDDRHPSTADLSSGIRPKRSG